MLIRLVLLLLAAIFSVATAIFAEDAAASNQTQRAFRLVGYLPDYRVAGFDASVCKSLTDVIFFSLQPTANGGLDRTQLSKEEKRLLQAIREQGPRLHISLGGGNRSEHFAAVVATDEMRAKLVNNVVQFLGDNRFDGVDVDWEFPNGEQQKADFARLLQDLRAALDLHHHELSIAIAGGQVLPRDAIEAVNFVHLMAYDGPGKHSTFEFAEEQVERVLGRGVPASKLCLGVPFYGRGIEHRARALSYAEIVRRHSPAAEADEAAGYYFNGPRTIKRKAQFAINKRLAGVMIWELGQDAWNELSLLNALHSTTPSIVDPE